jgi:DmsE family decaheme c-type cytochrome
MKSLGKILVFTMLFGGAVWAQEPAPETNSKDAACLKCHSEPVPLTIYKTKHGVRGDSRTPFCVSCHGESANHIADKKVSPDTVFKKGTFAKSDVKAMNSSCLACHDKDNSRHNWMGSAHQINDVACVNCHSMHSIHDKVREKSSQPEVCFTCHKDQKSESHKLSHHPINEGKVVCSDCHNLHGSAGTKLLKKNTVNETCFTCHAEKRGPFLWQHQSAMENCTNCHTVHGSNIKPLLKTRGSMMCDECHNGGHASTKSGAGPVMGGRQGGYTANPSTSYSGRACLNCHSMIHGSNHPAGAFFQR